MKTPDDGQEPSDEGKAAAAETRRGGAAETFAGARQTSARGEASGGCPQKPEPARKRRKRRHGRKVYVRGPAEPAQSRPAQDRQASADSGSHEVASRESGRSAGASPSSAAEPRDVPQTGRDHEGARQHPQPGRTGNAVRGAETRPGPARGGHLPVYAALDLGTNNCRLLVAIPARGGQFRVIDAFSRIVRLGEGLSASGALSGAAMDRAVDALAVCAEKLSNRTVRRSRLIATEACRSAVNGIEFLDRVQRETGLVLEIIDRETEARLAVSGCASLVAPGARSVVLFDIGGGSSEIALVDLTGGGRGRLSDRIVAWTSLPVGVVSLSERFGGRNVTPQLFADMIDDVGQMIARFPERERLGNLAGDGRFHLLGTSGTVTTLAGIHLDLPRYDRRRVDGLWMSADEVDAMIDRLMGWSFEERVANPCIGPDRADLVLAGCAILEAIRRQWPSERLRVADRGLREGMLAELMADDANWRRRRSQGHAA